ncbi:MAG TPA: hypothetical protein VHB46_12855 [Burkholderiales bacterium]|nr:hypothetical protein [Burkholderiales bacterium]
MIPPFNISGVLPPFVGSTPAASPSNMCPYTVTMLELVRRFCTTPERAKLLRGLIGFREALAAAGIVTGYQWIDGSFCEEVERLESRPPGDIDVVTTFARPASHKSDAAWQAFFSANPNLFDIALIKATWGCHAFFLDADYPLGYTIKQVTYWFGLFTHQRNTFLWKGLVQVNLASDDAAALAFIDASGLAP